VTTFTAANPWNAILQAAYERNPGRTHYLDEAEEPLGEGKAPVTHEQRPAPELADRAPRP
jgi:hypothetical protein